MLRLTEEEEEEDGTDGPATTGDSEREDERGKLSGVASDVVVGCCVAAVVLVVGRCRAAVCVCAPPIALLPGRHCDGADGTICIWMLNDESMCICLSPYDRVSGRSPVASVD